LARRQQGEDSPSSERRFLRDVDSVIIRVFVFGVKASGWLAGEYLQYAGEGVNAESIYFECCRLKGEYFLSCLVSVHSLF
jgi:hypothetical protein